MSEHHRDAQLELMAIQLESIGKNNHTKGFLGRLYNRWKNDFLKRNLREKALFIRYALHRAAKNLYTKLATGWRSMTHTRRGATGDRVQVAAVCNGGLGDMLIYSAFLHYFHRESGFPIIDVVPHPLRVTDAEFAFYGSPSIRAITPAAVLNPANTPYDMIVKIGDLFSYEFIRADRLQQLNPALLQRVLSAQHQQEKYRAFLDAQPLLDGWFASVASREGLGRLDVLGHLAQISFTQDHSLHLCPAPEAYAGAERLIDLIGTRYITIHNGWDNVEHRHAEQVTKAWPAEHWARFVAEFKQRLPGVQVVQVGANTSRPIPNVDVGLLNKTTLHEAAWILKHSELHVDGDSGLVHIARALHTTSVVLFGPTNHAFFHYPRNLQLVSTGCTNCWWITPDWMRFCPRGLQEPECMKSIEPRRVVDAAERYLRAVPAWEFDGERGRPARSGHLSGKIAILGEDQTPLSEPGRRQTIYDFRTQASEFGSYLNLPAENETYDAVVCSASIIDDGVPLIYALKEALRILKNGGVLVAPQQTAITEALARLNIRAGGDPFVIRKNIPSRLCTRAA